MASLTRDYCSLIIRASQFSSTTRNLVPRFKRRSKGEDLVTNSNESSWSWLLFSKRSIHYVDVFITLLQVIMMKSSSFLRELHRTYERIKGGYSGRTDLCKVDYLVYNIGGRWKVTLELKLKKISRVNKGGIVGSFEQAGNRPMPETGCERGSKQRE